jgi:hypothetical protein
MDHVPGTIALSGGASGLTDNINYMVYIQKQGLTFRTFQR